MTSDTNNEPGRIVDPIVQVVSKETVCRRCDDKTNCESTQPSSSQCPLKNITDISMDERVENFKYKLKFCLPVFAVKMGY